MSRSEEEMDEAVGDESVGSRPFAGSAISSSLCSTFCLCSGDRFVSWLIFSLFVKCDSSRKWLINERCEI